LKISKPVIPNENIKDSSLSPCLSTSPRVVYVTANSIFLLGDLFDFWFEYKKVIPKFFVRVLGKLGEIRDSGIPIYFFVGNHDLWMDDYFETELNIPVFHSPKVFTFNQKTFLTY